MPHKDEPRTQAQRTAETRAKLLDAARALFVEHGFSETGTPQIVVKAGITRGALYHHFADKRALFLTLVRQESAAVAAARTNSIDMAMALAGTSSRLSVPSTIEPQTLPMALAAITRP